MSIGTTDNEPVRSKYPDLDGWARAKGFDFESTTVMQTAAGQYIVTYSGVDYKLKVTADQIAETRTEFDVKTGKYGPVTEYFVNVNNTKSHTGQDPNTGPGKISDPSLITAPKGLRDLPDDSVAWDLRSMAQVTSWLTNCESYLNTLFHEMASISEAIGPREISALGTFPAALRIHHRHDLVYRHARTKVRSLALDLGHAADVTKQIAKNYDTTEERNALNAKDVQKLFAEAEADTPPPGGDTRGTSRPVGPDESPRSSSGGGLK